MRRFLRHTLTAITAIPLLLCIATIAVNVRSYWVAQFVGWSGSTQWLGILSMHGMLRFEHGGYASDELGWSHVAYPTPAGGLRSEIAARDRHGGPLRRAGFAYARIDYTSNGTRVRRALYLPHWFIAALFALPPALRLRRALRARHRPGLCPTCGYDLRATPTRCPECGAVPANAKP